MLGAIAAAVIAVNWLRLEQPSERGSRVLVLIVVAIAPALLRPRRLRIAGCVVAVFIGTATAFSLSPLDALPGGRPFFHPLGSRFSGAVADFYAVRLPVDPVVHARMQMLLLFAIFGFTMAVALAVAARQTVLAVVLFLVGAGWPATLLGGGNELLRGGVILIGALALLAGLTGRAIRLAVPAAGLVALGALALSASPAVAKPGFLDWQHWNPYLHEPKSVSVSYVWDGSYTGVRFPTRRTTVLTIAAPPSIGTYWRATVLDAYVGGRWVERLWRAMPREELQLAPPAHGPAKLVEQQVTVDALSDRHLVGADLPTAFDVGEPYLQVGQNVAVTDAPLRRGDRYLVWSYVPEPTPQQLVRKPSSYPRALTQPGRELEISRGVNAPAFGTADRTRILDAELTGPLEPYRRLFARARAVAGRTGSPYAAVVALERWLRTTGGFTYSQDPPQAPGLPPLVGFVLVTKAGYCQHFAGAMALMARLLGIPARVAAGFTTGTYANGTWTVTDHDAHTWVEVWFPGYGWLPFDPTPGRGSLAASYSDASPRFNAAAATRLLSKVVRGGEVFGKAGADVTPHRGRSLRPTVPNPGRNRGTVAPHGASLLRFLALLAVALVAAVVAAKLIRRRARYLTRDPRRIATACGHELADFLADQRLVLSPGATVRELGEAAAERLAVDASPFVGAAEAARFGPPSGARAEADRARKELRALKHRLRARLNVLDRVRGLVSLRSLGFS